MIWTWTVFYACPDFTWTMDFVSNNITQDVQFIFLILIVVKFVRVAMFYLTIIASILIKITVKYMPV